MTDGDIHNREATLRSTIQKISENSYISDEDKKILVEGYKDAPSFLSHLENQDMSKSRINRYMSCWNRIASHIDWKIREVDKAKMTELIGDLTQDRIKKRNGEPFAESTKREYKKSIRKLYTDYLEVFKYELDLKKSFNGEKVINFTLTIDRNYTDPDRLPKPNTVKCLIENTSRIRDKAYIMLLWSTGGRHGEILGLKWKDIKFTNSVGRVKFRDTKTGGDHTVPMGEAYPFVRKHRENDHKSNQPESFVFRSSQSDEQLSATGAANILKRARKDTKIPTRIKTNPHAFRKGRASYWARQGKSEAWICKHMNWAQGSGIVRYYCRMAQEDVERGVAEHLGLEHSTQEIQEERTILTPCECHHCESINSFEEEICENCGTVLKTGKLFEKIQIEQKTNKFMQEVIKSETRFDPDQLEQKAEEFIENELDI